MDRLILKTKLYVPKPREGLVSRPRLFERLDTGLQGKLILISAPAGFGKSTLLSDWIRHCHDAGPGLHVAWISLDENDNDLPRFLTYLAAAAAGAGVQVDNDLLAESEMGQAASWDALITALINGMPANTPLLFVLDDYHLITAASIHTAVTSFLDHLPPQAHLAISTRSDPPLALARRRAHGELVELRGADLRFTSAEAAEFLQRVMELDIGAEEIDALVTRTEGWIAGLQMAAISARGRSDVADYITHLSGTNRYVLDYLLEEVLQVQPAHMQEFLLRTSILERLAGSLCDAVTDCDDGQATLEQIEQANLFVAAQDDERFWYRYHRLFRDLLQRRLRQAYPDQVTTLHQRASHWYESEGLVHQAVEHALQAEDFAAAGRLLEQVAESTLMRSELNTFLGWMKRLPEGEADTRPALCLAHAWALFLSGSSLAAVEHNLRRAGDGTPIHSGRTAVLWAMIAMVQGRLSDAFRLGRQATEQLASDDSFSRPIALWNQGLAMIVAGDLPAGMRMLSEVAEQSVRMGYTMPAILALRTLAEMRLKLGQLRGAEALYRRALDSAIDESGRRLPIAGEALAGLGELAREWNDLEQAERLLSEGLALSEQAGDASSLDAYLSLAMVYWAGRNDAGAREAMRAAKNLARQFDATDWDDFQVACQNARLDTESGDTESVRRWLAAESSRVIEDSDPDAALMTRRRRRYLGFVEARLLLAEDRPAQALRVLDDLTLLWERHDTAILRVPLLVLRCLALEGAGERSAAIHALEEALEVAEPEGYVRTFVDEGPALIPLLQEAIARGAHPTYARRLLDAYASDKPVSEETTRLVYSSKDALVEPLSERERDVLRLLAAGMSTPDIAGELIIAVSTVRSHVKSIYGKLGVHSRWEAIQRAGELDII